MDAKIRTVAEEREASMLRQQRQAESRPRRCYTDATGGRTVSSDTKRWMPPAGGWEYDGGYRGGIPIPTRAYDASISGHERERLIWRLSDRLRELADTLRGRRSQLLHALARELGNADTVPWPSRTERSRTLRVIAADPALLDDPLVMDVARRLGFEMAA
jgi:hypothetical protein